MALPTVYRSLDSVLNTLNTHKHENSEAVDTLLKIYSDALKTSTKDEDKTHPLIILEGLDGSGKSTITRKLASKLNAAKCCTPPESIKQIRHFFDDHSTLSLRTAYYALGNYIAALECSSILREQPVVMDRYWHSTAAYAVAQAVHDSAGKVEMPPQGDSFYYWPGDLLKPSIVLFLQVSEDVRLQRLSRRTTSPTQEALLKNSKQFRDNVTLAYKNMVDPEVVFINGNHGVSAVLRDIEERINYAMTL